MKKTSLGSLQFLFFFPTATAGSPTNWQNKQHPMMSVLPSSLSLFSQCLERTHTHKHTVFAKEEMNPFPPSSRKQKKREIIIAIITIITKSTSSCFFGVRL
jgi:hypothetical protein